MLTLLSPAKTQDFSPVKINTASELLFKEETAELIGRLKMLKAPDLAKLMKISDKLSVLNAERFQQFDPAHYSRHNSKQALFAYQGDVYQGLQAESFTEKELDFAQKHLLIASGLYGLLRPLDLIQPYRLEMAIKLKTGEHQDLYSFWRKKLTAKLNELMAKDQTPALINLMSEEYAKAIDFKAIQAPVVQVDFKDFHQGRFKIIGLFAKRARGLMAHFIIKHQVDKLTALQDFNADGYYFATKASSPIHLVFERKKT